MLGRFKDNFFKLIKTTAENTRVFIVKEKKRNLCRLASLNQIITIGYKFSTAHRLQEKNSFFFQTNTAQIKF